MKKSLFLAIPLSLGCIISASASTTLATPVSLQAAGVAPGPSIAGGVLTLTTASNSESNQVGFDTSDPGIKSVSNFSFTFNISNAAAPANTADGFSFGWANTSISGNSGIAGNFGEEMNAPGILGVGFDTWNNAEVGGISDSNMSEISLHFNGSQITTMIDTRVAAPAGLGFAIDNAQDHVAAGTANFAAGTFTLTVDGLPVFTDQAIPGLAPMESRIIMGARTGGENELATISGLNVSFVPEPATALLSLLGVAGLLRRRR